MTEARTKAALWSFLFGNKLIGTGIMLPAGFLSVFMADLGLTAPTAGLLSLVGGLVVGMGAPLGAAFTFGVDRRLLLTLAIGFHVVGHIGTAGAMGSMGLALLAMALTAWTWGNYWVFLAAVCLWLIGGFAVNSFQQGRLVALAPALASATVALNTSAVYLGQATGARTGGVLVREAFTPSLALAAMALVIAGMAASVLADRLPGGR